MKFIITALFFVVFTFQIKAQNYTTQIDSFYVPTPEYSSSLGLDSLFFPCAITTPNVGNNFPVLILVHGTTDLNMDAYSTKDFLDSIGSNYRKAETKMFKEIADSLSRNGIIVLRYDKRSFTLKCIEKPACWHIDTISPYDYIKDINYAINYAKTITKADTCNIFLAGHSQGGSFVSAVGYQRNDIKGVLNMAGTAQPIDSVMIYQYEFINNDSIGANIIRQQFDSLRNNLWSMTDTLYQSHFSPHFWLDWISHTDSAIIVQKKSNKETALMYCTKDRFVPSSIHYQIWQDSISRPNVTFQLFDSLDHSFGLEYDSTMSPLVLNFMTNWILNTTSNCLPSSIDNNLKNKKAWFYPNPALKQITIENSNYKKEKIKILTPSGKLMLVDEVNNKSKKTIHIESLHKGLYIIKIGDQTYKLSKI